MAIVTLVAMVSIYFASTLVGNASTPAGIPARVATSSAEASFGTNITLFEASPLCTSRTITTADTGIWMAFEETTQGSVTTPGIASTTISASNRVGIYQAGTTTVTYDASQFGCGIVSGISDTNGTSTLSVMETQ